jgi:hypothetical protein
MGAFFGITKNDGGFTPCRVIMARTTRAIAEPRIPAKGTLMTKSKSDESVGRGDFLRLVALGGAGLGLSALAGCGNKASVNEKSRQGYVVAVTHGLKDPTRVMLALVTATKLPKGDNHVWFAIDGGEICKAGQAEQVSSPLFTKQGTAAKVIEEVRGQGTAIHI